MSVKPEKLSKMKKRAALLALSVALSIAAASCGGPQVLSSDAATGNCPVCQMKVKASDPWAAEIYYDDGTKLMFESFGDLLTFYSSPERFQVTEAQKDLSRIEKILAKDYSTKSQLDARSAVLVYKSKVDGPMGPDVLAFNNHEDAATFVVNNGGSIVKFDQLSPEMVKNLRKR